MAVVTAAVTVGTTATQLTAVEADHKAGERVMVKVPSGGSTVYLGAANVTTATGFPLAAGETFSDDFDANEHLYAVVASGTQSVNVYRGGV